jgi:hypothetical protein
VGDFSEATLCITCGAERFRKCSQISCRGLSSSECNHSILNKISNKSLYYRPITSLIFELLNTEGFLHALNYEFLNRTKSNKYMDISDGSTYVKHLNEMKIRFNSKFRGMGDDKPIMINLLMGQFYDGCAIFKKGYAVFWPLNCIILNLPPSYRIKLGIGMFLLSVFTSALKSNVHDFFLRGLVVEELKILYDGINMTVNGVNYFVQVRMILTILDTIGVEDLMLVQTNQAICGCFFCNHGKGYSRQTGSVVFIGHRNLTHLRHWLRQFGQSGKCCPRHYYKHFENKKSGDPYFEIIEFDSNNLGVKTILIPVVDEKNICDVNNSVPLSHWLNSNNKQWVWYHNDVDYNVFKNDLYFHNADYRPVMNYKRTTNADYIKCGNECINSDAVHVNGVKGIWAMSDLPYTNVETDCCWGPMHALMNVANNILQNWKGKRILKSSKIISYCKLTGTHPDLYKDSLKQTNQPSTIIPEKNKKNKRGEKALDDVQKNWKWEIPIDLQRKVFFNFQIN